MTNDTTFGGKTKITDEMIRVALTAFQSGDMDWSSQDEELMRFALEEALSVAPPPASNTTGNWTDDERARAWRDAFDAMHQRAMRAETNLVVAAELAEDLRRIFSQTIDWSDENGWTDAACQNDRIVDWFGPSDFAEMRDLVERLEAPVTPTLEPVKPLLSTCFKLSFDGKGRCTTFRKDQAEQLFGEWVWLIDASNGMNSTLYTSPPPPQTNVDVLRSIKAEAYAREAVPGSNAKKDAIRGTALALSARLSTVERLCRDALKSPPPQTRAVGSDTEGT